MTLDGRISKAFGPPLLYRTTVVLSEALAFTEMHIACPMQFLPTRKSAYIPTFCWCPRVATLTTSIHCLTFPTVLTCVGVVLRVLDAMFI